MLLLSERRACVVLSPPMWPSLAVPLQGQWQTVGPHFVAKVLSHTNVSYFSVKPNEGWGERYKEFSFRRTLWTDREHLSLDHSSLYCKKTLLCIWTGFYNEVFNILAIKKNLWLHISVSLFVHFLTKTSLSLCTHTHELMKSTFFRHTPVTSYWHTIMWNVFKCFDYSMTYFFRNYIITFCLHTTTFYTCYHILYYEFS